VSRGPEKGTFLSAVLGVSFEVEQGEGGAEVEGWWESVGRHGIDAEVDECSNG